MTTSKPRAAQTLAAWAWAAVGLTPVGWFYGFMAIGYSHLGDVTDRDMMFGGVVLFAVAPTIAFILAVYAARAGHRSGKIAVMVSGLLLLAARFLCMAERRVDQCSRNRRDDGGHGTDFGLGILPPQAAARARRCAAQAGTAYRTEVQESA